MVEVADNRFYRYGSESGDSEKSIYSSVCTKESLSVAILMDLNNCELWLLEWQLYYLPDLG